MVTFTLPEEFRSPARSHQKLIYNIFFRTSAQALQELALDPRFVGGDIGLIGVLQTWTRHLFYHPHIHYLVPGAGISPDGKKWFSAKENFLIHYKPLSRLFKGKFKAALKKTDLYDEIPKNVWQKEWGVHLKSVGNGDTALKYLAAYIYRIAISNCNILNLKDGMVTYRFRDSENREYRVRKLPALEFIRLFLQHVLPRGFVKVRYYGYLATKKRMMLNYVKELAGQLFDPKDEKPKPIKLLKCPNCGYQMILIGEFSKRRGPPQYALPLE